MPDFSARTPAPFKTRSLDTKRICQPVVLTEALSNRFLNDSTVAFILRMPVLPLLEGYWRRAGETRANRLSRSLKAKLADTLIAQCCLDYDAPLITYDGDFDNFVDLGLKLL